MHGEKIHAYGMCKLEAYCAYSGVAVNPQLKVNENLMNYHRSIDGDNYTLAGVFPSICSSSFSSSDPDSVIIIDN